MNKYNLSNVTEVRAAAAQAITRAHQEPDQSSYNAGWLHGYAKALADTANAMTPQWNLMEAIVGYMCEQCDSSELNYILREALGMTDEEISSLGIELL